MLQAAGKDVAAVLIADGLATPFRCSRDRCPAVCVDCGGKEDGTMIKLRCSVGATLRPLGVLGRPNGGKPEDARHAEGPRLSIGLSVGLAPTGYELAQTWLSSVY